MSGSRAYNDENIRDWWKHNLAKAEAGNASQGKHDKYKFMQGDEGWTVRKQMQDAGWDKMPDEKDAKNRINSIKDLRRIDQWMAQGDKKDEVKKVVKKEPKEKPYVKSKELADAETTIAEYEADRAEGKHANWIKPSSPAPANFDSVKARHKGEAMDIAKKAAQGFYEDYSANLIKEMKEDKENENPVLV